LNLLRGWIELGRKTEKAMKQESTSFDLVDRRSLPHALFLAGAMLFAAVSACSAAAQDPTSTEHGLVPALASNASAPETVGGIVASTDQRNDTLTIQLSATGTSGDFKVQDGLLFNSVRYGDPVEITVETIDGARTITGLKKK
jgi:hypothetical protein